jgi:hypothetical protein
MSSFGQKMAAHFSENAILVQYFKLVFVSLEKGILKVSCCEVGDVHAIITLLNYLTFTC